MATRAARMVRVGDMPGVATSIREYHGDRNEGGYLFLLNMWSTAC